MNFAKYAVVHIFVEFRYLGKQIIFFENFSPTFSSDLNLNHSSECTQLICQVIAVFTNLLTMYGIKSAGSEYNLT